MKNIPVFTSSYGIATLILREIPWNRTAYVLIQSVWNDQKAELLEECRGFCRAVGAEQIYATWGLEELPAEPVWEMQIMSRPKAGLPVPERPLALEPLTRENSGEYLRIYNACFREVPCAASYDQASLEPLYGEDLAWLAKWTANMRAWRRSPKPGWRASLCCPSTGGWAMGWRWRFCPWFPPRSCG